MFEWTRAWIRLRAEHPALRQGRLIDLFYDNDAYVFARQIQTETIIVAFNRSGQEKEITIPATIVNPKGTALLSLIGTEARASTTSAATILRIPARSAVAFKILLI
jgi:alpha-amylase